ncbi:MAG: DNA polymerase III subunit chi [Rickettsiales bacterium]|nr:DNA polymerase III subunit chi [Rickettsiales bacterium]
MDVQFYHLLTTPLERALPKLLDKARAAGMQSVIRVGDQTAMQSLNELLWSYDPASFMPHGSADDPAPELQPIYITQGDETPNGAEVQVVTDGRTIGLSDGTKKLLDIFDGHNEESVKAARARWKQYSETDANLSYIKQQPDGGWKKEA